MFAARFTITTPIFLVEQQVMTSQVQAPFLEPGLEESAEMSGR
jgi:hypothetical protein